MPSVSFNCVLLDGVSNGCVRFEDPHPVYCAVLCGEQLQIDLSFDLREERREV